MEPAMMKTLSTTLVLLALTACSTYRPQDIRAGQSEAELQQLMGKPTSRYAGPKGQTRLEFASGPYGRTTWLVDVDAAGKVLDWDQVLNEGRFAWVQQNFQGRDKDWLLYTLGRPGEVRGGGWQGGQVWSWRYFTNPAQCLWYQVSILDNGMLRDGGAYGIDPHCDPGSAGNRK
jgi:hypothetical protein